MCLAHFYRYDPHYVPSLHLSFFDSEVIVFRGANYLQMSMAQKHVLWIIWREVALQMETIYVTCQKKGRFLPL
jgi:hypothetical protein